MMSNKAPPPPPGSEDTGINNVTCAANTSILRLHRQQHGGQDKSSSLFSYIALFFNQGLVYRVSADLDLLRWQ